jgi:hypothetical protein
MLPSDFQADRTVYEFEEFGATEKMDKIEAYYKHYSLKSLVIYV